MIGNMINSAINSLNAATVNGGICCTLILVKIKRYLCGLPLCQQQICLKEEIDAYLCASSRLSSELRLFDIYAERVFNSIQRALGSSLQTELTR